MKLPYKDQYYSVQDIIRERGEVWVLNKINAMLRQTRKAREWNQMHREAVREMERRISLEQSGELASAAEEIERRFE